MGLIDFLFGGRDKSSSRRKRPRRSRARSAHSGLGKRRIVRPEELEAKASAPLPPPPPKAALEAEAPAEPAPEPAPEPPTPPELASGSTGPEEELRSAVDSSPAEVTTEERAPSEADAPELEAPSATNEALELVRETELAPKTEPIEENVLGPALDWIPPTPDVGPPAIERAAEHVLEVRGPLRELAESGDSGAQLAIGLMFRHGHGVRADAEQARRWLERATENDERSAAFELGQLAQDAGDGDAARDWWARAARRGHDRARRQLATELLGGDAQERNQGLGWLVEALRDGDEAAVELLEEEARAGHVEAAFHLGVHGLRADPPQASALRWFEEAAEAGLVEAQFNLGVAHLEGCGTPVDLSRAAHWFRQAAARGDAAAQYNLGTLMLRGLEGEPDSNAALEWFRRAAEAGSRPARQALMQMTAPH